MMTSTAYPWSANDSEIFIHRMRLMSQATTFSIASLRYTVASRIVLVMMIYVNDSSFLVNGRWAQDVGFSVFRMNANRKPRRRYRRFRNVEEAARWVVRGKR